MSMPRVLVVDSEELMLRLLLRLFDGKASVTCASSSDVAMNLIDSNRYDLILADFGYSNKRVIDLISFAAKKCPSTARLIMTGLPTDVISERKIASFVDYVIYKPFRGSEVLGEIMARAEVAMRRRLS